MGHYAREIAGLSREIEQLIEIHGFASKHEYCSYKRTGPTDTLSPLKRRPRADRACNRRVESEVHLRLRNERNLAVIGICVSDAAATWQRHLTRDTKELSGVVRRPQLSVPLGPKMYETEARNTVRRRFDSLTERYRATQGISPAWHTGRVWPWLELPSRCRSHSGSRLQPSARSASVGWMRSARSSGTAQAVSPTSSMTPSAARSTMTWRVEPMPQRAARPLPASRPALI